MDLVLTFRHPRNKPNTSALTLTLKMQIKIEKVNTTVHFFLRLVVVLSANNRSSEVAINGDNGANTDSGSHVLLGRNGT